MALFMDVHNVEGGVSAADVAGAYQADLATQAPYGVSYLRYCSTAQPSATQATTPPRPCWRRSSPRNR
jgi:hypothetical protein